MKFILTAAILPSLGLAAAVPAKSNTPATLFRRQGGGPECSVLSGGPGEAAKQAVGDFFRNTYISGRVCPEGEDGITGPEYTNWCGVCQGAALYFNNGHSDVSKVCFTVDDFNTADDTLNPNGQTCYSDMKKDPYLQLLYGNPTNFDSGGEEPCTNVC